MNWIEIGACDYDTVLHSNYHSSVGWGIVMEPIRQFLHNLPDCPNVIYLPCALTAHHDGYKDFYAPIDDPEPSWVRSMGSLQRHPTLKSLGIRNQTRIIQVPTMSLNTFYSHIPDNKIHFLKLDTEGNDYEILSHWDFDRFLPHKIQFESKLMSPAELQQTQHQLSQKGYCVCAGLRLDYNGIPYNHVAMLEI